MNDFQTDLAFSETMSEDEFWEGIYRKAFPDMIAQVPCMGDTQAQRLGIDRFVHLSSGRVLRIDEKKRREDWPDIFLETVSVDTTGAPGWIEKDLAIDYLAYAFMPSKTCYLFPWDMLRRAWINFGAGWKQEYGVRKAKNREYTTIGVPVPINILRRAVSRAAVIQL